MFPGMNSNGNWRISITEGARKSIKRLPRHDRERVEREIDEMEKDPFRGDVVNLKGEEDTWRRRVGSYRLLFKVLSKERAIFVREVKRRTSSTY